MPLVYRFHYLAAMLLLFCLAVFITDWQLRRERGLSVPGGQWIRHLRGLAHELPRPLGVTLGYVIGLDMRRAPPPQEQFTFYERVFSFPTWVIALTLIVITGLLKAMRYIYPIPGDVLYWASAIHVGAMVLLAIKLLDHVRYVLAPSRWPLFVSMLTGWLPGASRSTSETAPTPQAVSSVRSKEAV
jgi:thiosulfate reductase cytochrome b subunit